MAKPRKNSAAANNNNNDNSTNANNAVAEAAAADVRAKPKKRTRKSVPRESPSQRSSIYRGVTRYKSFRKADACTVLQPQQD